VVLIAISGSAVRWKGWFGLLFPHRRLDFHSSSLKLIQSLFQVSHFLFDLTQLYPILAAGQAVCAKLLNDIPLKLTSQDPEIRITPNRSFSVFQFAGSNALHNKVPTHSIFLFCRYVTEGCPFAISFSVFCHILTFDRTHD